MQTNSILWLNSLNSKYIRRINTLENTETIYELDDIYGYYTIQFLNDMIGFIITNKGILRTIDGGNTWEFISTYDLKRTQNGIGVQHSTSIIFTDENTGYIISDKNRIQQLKLIGSNNE